ncbi:hypothetical protein E4U43_007579 [Claviceps pusilla]|uniref:non-specific serine/threonine protein kinase n=1 Tax=Claviceps pusilla TaxID=123648 RepID=A0A9P7NEI9_9HYPO|nr:hypothetical protein E4U43_007579 [Claviceps pusilla]
MLGFKLSKENQHAASVRPASNGVAALRASQERLDDSRDIQQKKTYPPMIAPMAALPLVSGSSLKMSTAVLDFKNTMDDENLIARVYPGPYDPHNLAHHAIECSDYRVPLYNEELENEVRYGRDDDEISEPAEDNDADNLDDSLHLEIRFDRIPASRSGIIFGCNSKCDVVLPAIPGLSNYHFCLMFDHQGRLIVRDVGTRSGTQVTYSGQCREYRRNFIWIVSGFEHIEKSDIIVTVHHHVQFSIKPARQVTTSPSYLDKVERFKQGTTTGEDLLQLVQLDVPNTEPDSQHTPGQGPLYVVEEIGRGGYGVATRRFNVSDGSWSVLKEPTADAVQKATRDNAKFVKLFTLWRKEAEIMSKLSHPHILKLFKASFDLVPQLELEYMPYGSLNLELRGFEESGPKVDEMRVVATQGLSALVYLHGQGIAHRDITPNNILVKTRHPLHIVLADFGVAKDAMELSTRRRGTRTYAAPEMHESQDGTNYTTAVDVWSRGVVVTKFLKLMPRNKVYYRLEQRGLASHRAWCDIVVNHVQGSYECHWDKFRQFLVEKMLRLSPEERAAAQDCLEHIQQLSDEIDTTNWPTEPADENVLWRKNMIRRDDGDGLDDFTTGSRKQTPPEGIEANLSAEPAGNNNDKLARPASSSQRPIAGSAAPPPSGRRLLEPNEPGSKRGFAEAVPEDPNSKRRGRVSTSQVRPGPGT